jgi:choline dehydrogenase-like flavoprotein
MDKGLTLCLAEAGSIAPDPRAQRLLAGLSAGRPTLPLDRSRIRVFGGTSAVWEGRCMAIPPHVLPQRPGIPHSGWPIAATDLAPFWEGAEALAQVAPGPTDASAWDAHGAAALPLDPARLAARFWKLSPPTRFGPVEGARLAAARNLTILLGATAVALRLDAGRSHLEGLELASPEGPRRVVRARRFVLACGAIETARLLLQTGAPADPGGWIGRSFMDQPTAVLGEVDAGDPALLIEPFLALGFGREAVEAGLALPAAAQAEAGVLDCVLWLDAVPGDEDGVENVRRALAALEDGDMDWLAVRRIAADWQGLAHAAWRRVVEGRRAMPAGSRLARIALKARVEQAPDRRSRVQLLDERDPMGMRRVGLDWRLGRLERRTLAVAAMAAAREIGRLGLGRVRLRPWVLDEEEPDDGALVDSGHHMGTTRMAADPAGGVVDADCRVHGIDNLYIAGPSVFPSAGAADPMLTALALAQRLAAHLAATG